MQYTPRHYESIMYVNMTLYNKRLLPNLKKEKYFLPIPELLIILSTNAVNLLATKLRLFINL